MPLRRALSFWAMLVAIAAASLLPNTGIAAEGDLRSQAKYARWKNGPPTEPSFFPIAVWLQSPKNAARYKAAGINTYVGLWRGPTEEQLQILEDAGMRLVCAQNSTGLSNKDNPLIIGWMHGDEPDNAQAKPGRKGYGPPILPEKIVANYERIHAADPTRPVLLNLGQGVAWDNYIGRGVRRNHPEDYKEYVKGCDIASFDIYPAVHSDVAIAGKLEFVPQGVDRLVQWAGPGRIVWNCIEASRISNVKTKPTGEQIRSEVWMSLIHGSRGIIYFVHQFKPTFQEASLLEDSDLLAAVTAINQQIQELAPVLNSPTIAEVVEVSSFAGEKPISVMTKDHNDAMWLFAANMRDQPTRGTFKLGDRHKGDFVEVLHEARKIALRAGQFIDAFSPYAVHLYRIPKTR